MLVYDEGRSFYLETELPPEVEEALDGRPKAYFFAKILGTDLVISLAEAGEQDW